MGANQLDILYVVEACGGGVRRHVNYLLPELIKRKLKCGIFAFGRRFEPTFPQDLEDFQRMGCKVWAYPYECHNIVGLPSALKSLKAVLAEERPKTMHLHASVAGLVGRMAKPASPTTKILYSPHAFAIHPSLPVAITLATKTIERWGAKRTNAYVFVGRAEIHDANELELPANKFNLIENGLPDDFEKHLLPREEARKKLNIPQDQLVGVVPCRLARQKGLPQLIEAFAIAKSTQLTLAFCGDGPERESLKSLAKQLDVFDRTLFMGAIPGLAQFLPAFDLAILPSLYEGLSYVLLECITAKVPLVVSDILANVPRPELRQSLTTFTVGDQKQLAQELDGIIENPTLAQERAIDAHSIAKTEFRLEEQADRLAALYRSLF